MENQQKLTDHPWFALFGPMLGAFVGMLSETSLNIAPPQLSRSLGVGNDLLQWIVTGYMLVIGIVLPLSSLLTKWLTTRQIITTGLSAFIGGAIISALAPNFPPAFGWTDDSRNRNRNNPAPRVHRGDEHFPA